MGSTLRSAGRQQTEAATKGEDRITIQASPENVYAMVSDVARMGEWSPECHSARWLGGVTEAAVGAKFKGHNKRGRARWSTVCTVIAAEPGREFAFENRQTVWRYRFEPAEGGTTVFESFETKSYGLLSRVLAPEGKREAELVEGVRVTLEGLKAAAEGG